MQQKIIQAIKDFDISALNVLLDDKKSYMDVSKTLFLKTLEEKFEFAKMEGCHYFDDVFFGICEYCNKGCEDMTFWSKSGLYLDFYIESKDEVSVDDMYVCNKLTNIIDLDKRHNLSFSFDKDEAVKFRPSKEYVLVKTQFEQLKAELKDLENGISYDDFLIWYDDFSYLRTFRDEWDPFTSFGYKLYRDIFHIIWKINSALEIKENTENAIEDLIEIQRAKGESEKLICFFENRENCNSSWKYTSIDEVSCKQVTFNFEICELLIDITGYEYVLDYFRALQVLNDEIMEKYKPLPEHYKQSETGSVEYSLENFLTLHQKHLDLVERYRQKDY